MTKQVKNTRKLFKQYLWMHSLYVFSVKPLTQLVIKTCEQLPLVKYLSHRKHQRNFIQYFMMK